MQKNVIVTSQQSSVAASYVYYIKRDFGAEPYQWNFIEEPQNSKNKLNAKIAKYTVGRFKNFLEPSKSITKWLQNL